MGCVYIQGKMTLRTFRSAFDVLQLLLLAQQSVVSIVSYPLFSINILLG